MDLKDGQFKTPKHILLWILLVAGLGIIFQLYVQKQIDDRGVYLKAAVLRSEGSKSSVLITIQYKFGEEVIQGIVHSKSGRGAIPGKQYFIKVLPEDPRSVTFLRENPVPGCLLNIDSPPDGWKMLPTCE